MQGRAHATWAGAAASASTLLTALAYGYAAALALSLVFCVWGFSGLAFDYLRWGAALRPPRSLNTRSGRVF